MIKLRRREFIQLSGGMAAPFLFGCTSRRMSQRGTCRLAIFSADVTPPLGHPLMGGGIEPASMIDDPLFAHGCVLLSAEKPVVLVAVDWCEIRNDAYERWQSVLAAAARTDPARVFVTSVHVHDAPIADLEAERLLQQVRAGGSICDLTFHERIVQGVAKAMRTALQAPQIITHVGIGQAKVEKIASNRRYVRPDGKPTFGRTSSTLDPQAQEAPEGTIDPWLKTLSFWDRDRPVAALSCYATHPMSHYGKGRVSSDFVGLARHRRQADQPNVAQLYFSGCSGNVTAGKYNDGSPGNRRVLADRLYRAMAIAWEKTKRHPLKQVNFRSVPLELVVRNSPGFTPQELKQRLIHGSKPFDQCLAALGLSWRTRSDAGDPIDLPLLDLGVAQLLLLPGEAYVEYQLLAQQQRPDSFVMVMGYGECAPGYIPMEQAWREQDTNLREWCWVAPGAEEAMTRSLKMALKP